MDSVCSMISRRYPASANHVDTAPRLELPGSRVAALKGSFFGEVGINPWVLLSVSTFSGITVSLLPRPDHWMVVVNGTE